MKRTGCGSLLDWIREPADAQGIHRCDGDGEWSFHPYVALAARARRAQAQLKELGVGEGDVVAIILDEVDEFTAGFFGCLLTGATPAPLAPWLPNQALEDYLAQLVTKLQIASPAALITAPSFRGLAATAIAISGSSAALATLDPTVAPAADPPHALPELALLQFTAGSTGTPRAVKISNENLETNLHLIAEWTKPVEAEAGASWLPLYHDMGLIGCLLVPVLTGTSLWSMRPEQFIRHPRMWLECFGMRGATLTASPTFGLAYVTRRVDAAILEGMSFAAWRAVIVGAERVDPLVLREFAQFLAPYGFREEALWPAYGLAEATLAVTGARSSRTPSIAKVDWQGSDEDGSVKVERITTIGEAELRDGTQWVVGTGTALGDLEVEVWDDAGGPVPDHTLGEIAVSGPSVAEGYLDDAEQSEAAFERGWLRTGDAGFLDSGQLYVVGRIGDSLKIRGRHVYAETLEGAIARSTGLSPGRLAVLLGVRRGVETVCLVNEGRFDESMYAAATSLIRREAAGAQVKVLTRAPGTVMRTSSGKVRRREMWRRFVSDQL